MNNGLQYFGGTGSLGGGGGSGSGSLWLPQRVLIGPQLEGYSATVFSSAAVTTAQTAYVVPFWLPRPCKLTNMRFMVGASAGTVDIGIYKDLGNLGVTASKIISSGAVTVSAGFQSNPVPSILLTGGDQRYFAVITGSTVTTLTLIGMNFGTAVIKGDMLGLYSVAGAGPTLGASLTLAAIGVANQFIPAMAIDLVSPG